MFNCLRNPSGLEIRSVAVEMSDMLEQCKEVVEEMTRKVVEFVENNMGMVEDNLGQVGNNLEEARGNMVEEYFSGDDVGALQVIVFSYFLTDPLHSVLIQLATYTFFNFQNLTSGTVLLFFFGM